MNQVMIGHTGITWGIPGDVETAYRDVAEVGYQGFETFTRTIRSWNERPGGYRQLVDRFGIPTSAGYCYKEWINASATAEIEEAKREADALSELPGGATLVLQAGSRPKNGYAPDDFSRLADALNGFGDYCNQIGLVAGLHPHAGTAVQTRSDIDTIMELLDPAKVGFAPDTGQLAEEGIDVVAMIRRYRDQIVHIHLKDGIGAGHHSVDAGKDLRGSLEFTAVGDGELPMAEVIDVLMADGHFDGWMNVELDPSEKLPRPRDAAARSRRYLGAILGENLFASSSQGS